MTDTLHITGRHFRAFLRQPWWVAVALVQPVIWLLLYGALFKRIVDIPGFHGGSYITFLAPGVTIPNGGVSGANYTLTSTATSQGFSGFGNNVGFFGYSSGTISNIGLSGGNFSGNFYVGSLAGFNLGTITQAWSSASVSGAYTVGGLAGYSNGMLSRSYATGNVQGSYAGGLVGYNIFGSVSESWASGALSGSTSGGLIAGGDFSWGGSVTSSYWDKDTTGAAKLLDDMKVVHRLLLEQLVAERVRNW